MSDISLANGAPPSLLAGKVAVVTGAGRGIGRAHALLLAQLGAAVVVNDLGGANDGSGSDATPAQLVEKEIFEAGGQASSNTDDVSSWAGGASLVQHAVDEFGRLDIVVNNAGILRDGFVASMTEQQWDAVIAVHLKGHFSLLHHAAEYWKAENKAGREVHASVINTASASGTFATLAGQANYAAAKAGIAAMTKVAAVELERYGVRVNAIAPVARTRLTLATPGMEAIFNQELEPGEFDAFDPANISPIVAYLAGDACTLTGRVFAVQGGAISEMEGWHDIRAIETDGPWTVEDLATRLGAWA